MADSVIIPPLSPKDIDRLESKFVITAFCWEWIASVSTKGYGQFAIRHRTYTAHRVAYAHYRAAIPDGLQLDHLCRNRLCVNPWHLEPVTGAENTRRGKTIAAAHAAKTHCPAGHPYAGDNLYIKAGRRYCRACGRERMRRKYWATKSRTRP